MCEKIDCVNLYHHKKSDDALRNLVDRLLFRTTYIDGDEQEFIYRILMDALDLDKATIQKVAENNEKDFQKRMKQYEQESNE